MSVHLLLRAAHLVVVLAFVLLLAQAGRAAMRRLGQPAVIGEILVGILLVPAVLLVAGRSGLDVVLPTAVLAPLNGIGQAGLVLFLVGVAYELRQGIGVHRPGAVGWVAAGSVLPSLVLGALFGVWLLGTADGELRGTAPAPAFVLLIAVCLTITAVPVLARILSERDMTATRAGVFSMAAAAVTDITGWLLLAVAVGLTAGGLGGALGALVALGVAAALAAGLRLLLRSRQAVTAGVRFPKSSAVVLAAAALAFSVAVEEAGLTLVFGALLMGLAVPGDRTSPWEVVVRRVSNVGRLFVPVFFVAAGVGLAAGSSWHLPWLVCALATMLAIVAKIGGGYLGARLARESRRDSLTVGVLLNTRGLTEIVVLQAGYSAGILTATSFFALVVMALITTALTGPLLSLMQRRPRDRVPAAYG